MGVALRNMIEPFVNKEFHMFSISLSLSAVDLINRKIQHEITLFQEKNVYLS